VILYSYVSLPEGRILLFFSPKIQGMRSPRHLVFQHPMHPISWSRSFWTWKFDVALYSSPPAKKWESRHCLIRDVEVGKSMALGRGYPSTYVCMKSCVCWSVQQVGCTILFSFFLVIYICIIYIHIYIYIHTYIYIYTCVYLFGSFP